MLAKELGDVVGENTAKMNVSDLRKILGMPDFSPETETASTSEAASQESINEETSSSRNLSKQFRMRRQSMEQLDLIKVSEKYSVDSYIVCLFLSAVYQLAIVLISPKYTMTR
jgi:G-protein signaling modulator 2